MARKPGDAQRAEQHARRVARVRARLRWERRRGNVALLSAAELDELHALIVKTDATAVQAAAEMPTTVVTLSTLTDAEYGRYQRLLDKAAGSGRQEAEAATPTYTQRVLELARAALGPDVELAADVELKTWAQASEATGAVLASRELYEQVVSGTLEAADVLALLAALWALQLAGKPQATFATLPFAGSVGRDLHSSLKHLEANGWLQVERLGGGGYTVGTGPLARAQLAVAQRTSRAA